MRLLLEWMHWKCNGVTVRGGWWEGEGYNGPLWTQTQPVHPRAEWVRVKQSWQERSSVEMHWRCLNITRNFHWITISLNGFLFWMVIPLIVNCFLFLLTLISFLLLGQRWIHILTLVGQTLRQVLRLYVCVCVSVTLSFQQCQEKSQGFGSPSVPCAFDLCPFLPSIFSVCLIRNHCNIQSHLTPLTWSLPLDNDPQTKTYTHWGQLVVNNSELKEALGSKVNMKHLTIHF